MHEFYKELGYAPKKTTWKFGVMVFITIIIPLMFLIGISAILSLPILVKRKLTN